MGEIQATDACQQELAADSRHGVEQMDMNGTLSQYFCSHQAGRTTSNNDSV